MTLKYESEILFGLMKRDGDDSPSDVLPYESELKEKYLNQVTGAYPKLQDYRPEWLNYNLYKHLPADFPVETVSKVTEASFQNVVPYAFGKAELKGQTLVNLFNGKNPVFFNERIVYENNDILLYVPSANVIVFNKSNKRVQLRCRNTVEQTYDYYVYINANSSHILNPIYNIGQVQGHLADGWANTDESKKELRESILIIEYQEGMENWNIPYFEGMQSVKMPVVTTTGKNLFKTFKNDGYYNNSIDGDNAQWINDSNFKCLSANVLPNTRYTQSSKGDYTGNIITFWKDGKFTGESIRGIATAFITPSNCDEIRASCSTKHDLQLELGQTATSYEPYKSNILTVNEEVELRGIGDVQDTLDCLTGEVTQRIGEIVLDGSENWKLSSSGYFWLDNRTKFNAKSSAPLCDKLLSTGGNANYPQVPLFDNLTTVDEFKTWLSENNVKMQYQLETPTIKTVELTCKNEQGQMVDFMPLEGTMYVKTSSDTIPPLLDMDVPVEAITQNLNSFTSMGRE